MVIHLEPRRCVALPNYLPTEGQCKCGCGQQLRDDFVLLLQALIHRLSRNFAAQVRHKMTSGARCEPHNKAEGGAKYSQHIWGRAADGTFEFFDLKKKTWVQISNDMVAQHAIQIGLFGGVGWRSYQSEGKNLVHLDSRDAFPAVTW